MKDLDLPWIIDPKTGESSVSLTMLVVTFVLVLVAVCLSMAGVIKDTSIVTELFYGNLALYFGRRLSFSNKTPTTEVTVDQPK